MQKKFHVYKSSAGSGKTFTLVREFLQLVLQNPNLFRNILAITFTNKAANEMKSRIIDSLTALSEPVDSWPESIKTMIAGMKKENGYKDEFISDRARMVLANILHNYSDLSATTIDSFMQRVIRTFSLDLSLPQNYEVELEVALLRQRAVDRLIDQAGTNRDLTDLLVHYLETKTEDDKSWRIEKDLDNAAQALFKEDGAQHRDTLNLLEYKQFREYFGKITAWISEFEDETSQSGIEALKLLDQHALSVDDFAYGKSGVMSYFLKLSQARVGELSEPGQRVLAAINEGKWVTQKQKTSVAEKIEGITDDLIDYYEKSRKLIEDSLPRYKTLKLLLSHLYPMAVLSSIEKIIEEIREEERILPISEFNRIIARVTQNETVPYIYERLGEKYRHLMIDEFQDTSVLQWQNLLPLVENALSGNHLNLVVGDAKQAIYRWRNGEVDQFIALPHLPEPQTEMNRQRAEVLAGQYLDQVLPVNWRSHKAIVEFNNNFFRHLSKRLAGPYAGVYDALDQKHNPDKENGLVQLEFFDRNEEPEQAMLDRLPELVAELLEQNYNLSEISILCRTNYQGSRIANHLLVNGISVISSESLLLGFAEDARLLASMLRIMADPADQLAYPEALSILTQKGVFSSLSLNEVIPIVHLPEDSESQKRSFRLHAFEDLLQKYGIDFRAIRLQHLPLYDLAEELIRIFGLSVSRNIYLQFFLNELHRVVSGKHLELKDFYTWWEEKGRNVSVIFPDNLNAVRVMTIHKAKGLEFPVVIFPFATASQRFTVDHVWVDLNDPLAEALKSARLPVKSLGGTVYENLKTIENDKSLLDLVNLLYVAFTRAEERLYVLTNASGEKDREKNHVPAFICDYILSTDPGYDFTAPWVYSESAEVIREPAPLPASSVADELAGDKPSKRWQQRILTSCRSHGKWYEEEPEIAVEFGVRIHNILASLLSRADMEMDLNALLLSGNLPESEMDRFSKTLSHIIDHPELQQFFSWNPGLLCEPDILMPGGETLRPDRVLLSENKTEVAEFKTGLQRPTHKTQLLEYMDTIKRVYPHETKGYLVYADEESCTVETIEAF